MKFTKSYILLLVFEIFLTNPILSQVSHGGTPLFFNQTNLLKNSISHFFIEMPAFNLDSLLQEDKVNESNMRGAFRFAEKFYVNIEKDKCGRSFVLADGTKVWQVGIKSQGAYSINVFFSDYHLPEGGKLFLYNSDRSHVIGSFTHENNSENNILPIRPVQGDEIIVEYQEPKNVAFEARLKISEVNHDYRDLLNYEPKIEAPSSMSCMPDILCQNKDDKNNRSSVLITINGTTACSGALINNTNNDGTPLLLTAVHCLNNSFTNPNVDYTLRAGSVICFFNYNKPVCKLRMKGSEEMTVAGTTPASIAIKNDMALLQLKETPPDYYKPYYAGWNADSTARKNLPFINIHHPSGSVAKYGYSGKELSLSDFETDLFNPNSHWKVQFWDIGSTANGSSGSPLFNNEGLIVGGLSGGGSLCSNSLPDYFFALHKSWEYTPDVGELLKNCLDPNNTGAMRCNGFDPSPEDYSIFRLSNSDYNGSDSLVISKLNAPGSGPVFGHNSLMTTEYAEEFNVDNLSEIIGTYLITSTYSLNFGAGVKINLYQNSLSPENIMATEVFLPRYAGYDNTSESFIEYLKSMGSSTESFIKFSNKIDLKGKFYISYSIAYPSSYTFIVYNALFGSEKANTTWYKNTQGNWIKATEHPNAPMSTSLAIEPLIRYKNPTGITQTRKDKSQIFYNKATQELLFETENADKIDTIEIYSVTGRLMKRIKNQGNHTVNISDLPKENIFIVKCISGNDITTNKVAVF